MGRNSIFVSTSDRNTAQVAPADETMKQATDEGDAFAQQLLQVRAHMDLLNQSRNQRWRIKVGHFMQLLGVELFFISLVIIYGIMTFTQMAIEDVINEDPELKRTFDITDIVLGSALLIEVMLKCYAFGWIYFKNCWNSFDAVVVVLSFGLSILQALALEEGDNVKGADAGVLVRLFRLRIVLRLLRVLVVFERVKAKTKVIKKRGAIESPLEHVLRVLTELHHHPGLHPRIISEVEYCVDIIRENRLYDTGAEILEGQDMDKDMEKWLKGEIMKGNKSNQSVLSQPGNHTRRSAVSAKLKPTIRTASEQNLMPLNLLNEDKLNGLFLSLHTWDFDVFAADLVTEGNALSHIALYLFHHQELHEVLDVEMIIVSNFFTLVQQGYMAKNPYHNAIHGADVMQSVHYFTQLETVREHLTPLDQAVALIAAACHDLGHNGVNNAFHIAEKSKLAVRYNDQAVLENFHVAQAFHLMFNVTNDANVFEHLSPEDMTYARGLMIEMVLATDMSKHFADVAMFKTKIVNEFANERIHIESVMDKNILLKLVLHTSDISNPAKPRKIMLRWTDRVVEEFFEQGDQELAAGRTVSMFMDRRTPTLMKSQCGFIDFIVKPLFELWSEISPQVERDGFTQIVKNREFWQECGEHFLPSDIKGVVDSLDSSTTNDDHQVEPDTVVNIVK